MHPVDRAGPALRENRGCSSVMTAAAKYNRAPHVPDQLHTTPPETKKGVERMRCIVLKSIIFM